MKKSSSTQLVLLSASLVAMISCNALAATCFLTVTPGADINHRELLAFSSDPSNVSLLPVVDFTDTGSFSQIAIACSKRGTLYTNNHTSCINEINIRTGEHLSSLDATVGNSIEGFTTDSQGYLYVYVEHDVDVWKIDYPRNGITRIYDQPYDSYDLGRIVADSEGNILAVEDGAIYLLPSNNMQPECIAYYPGLLDGAVAFSHEDAVLYCLSTEGELWGLRWANCQPVGEPYFVKDIGDGSYAGLTTISPFLHIVTPNGGEVFPSGSSTEIRWLSADGIEWVRLDFSCDSGETWETLDVVENTGSYEWVVPRSKSDHCLIQVTDAAHSEIADSSNGVFSIWSHEWYYFGGHAYALTFRQSNWGDAQAEAEAVGGYLVVVNNEEERDWLINTEANPFGTVYMPGCPDTLHCNAIWIGMRYTSGDIHSQDAWEWVNGDPLTFWEVQPSFYTYDGVHMAMTGAYHDIGPGQFTNGPHCDNNPANYLYGVIERPWGFGIVRPEAGEYILAGEIHTIVWNMMDPVIQFVRLEFSSDSGGTWETLDLLENTGSYDWLVPDLESDQCLIRVSDLNNPEISATSGLFTISPYERVHFNDANLKAKVEEALGIENPNTNDMLALTTLDARRSGITDLTGLEYAENLSVLYLYSNRITDLGPISLLPNLVYVSLSDNQIDALPDLSQWTHISKLYLHGNRISDISALAIPEITTLGNLYIYDNERLPLEAYRDHIPAILANNPHLSEYQFRYDPNCRQTLLADVNGDCLVNIRDLAVMAEEWMVCDYIYSELCP